MNDLSPETGATPPPRILWLVMGTETYGVRRITGVMWKYLERRGVGVHVVSVHEGEIAVDGRSLASATDTLQQGSHGALATQLRRVRLFRNLLYAACHASTLRRMINRERIDLLQLRDIDLVPLARLAVFRTEARVCYLTPNSPPVHRVARMLFPMLMRGRRIRVLANSDDIRTRFAEAGVPSDTLRLGVDLDDFVAQPLPDQDTSARFVIAARICAAKAQDLWVTAFLELLRRGCDVRLTIVGGDFEPDFAERLRSTIAASDHPDRFELLGSRSDISDLLAASHVALCGQREIEPFGLSAVEALACARPVVVLGDGGIREIVLDGETGWFVPSVDVASLVETVQACLNDRERWAQMGLAGRADMAQRFSATRVVDDFLTLNSTQAPR